MFVPLQNTSWRTGNDPAGFLFPASALLPLSARTSKRIFSSLVGGRPGIGKSEILETVHGETIPVCEVKLTDDALFKLAGIFPGTKIYQDGDTRVGGG